MSYSNFGRGRGFRPQGTRAAHHFGRPRFPRPPFRHAGPPRPGHPASFGMPWRPNNMFFQSHQLRGSPSFRPDGRRRTFCGYEVRFPAPGRLPVPPGYEEAAVLPSSGVQVEIDQADAAPQLPLLGSEEERQQKITETADRLKQKLSSFSSDEMTHIWSDNMPSDTLADDCTETRAIPVVGYKSSEISLTYNDLKDIGRINPDNAKLDNTPHMTDIFNVTNNTDGDVILNENEAGSHLIISNDQMTSLEVVPDNNEYMVMDSWGLHESADNLQNLEQSDAYADNNIENELLQSDLQYQYSASPAGTSQDQHDQQQDISQGIDIHPTDTAKEQDDSETLNLQAVSFPIDSEGQDILQNDVSEGGEKSFTISEVQESVSDSHIHAESSNSSSCALTKPALADMSVNNVALDNQLSGMKENSFHSGPPELSPHTEQELPVDFDPTTPPPILLKQEQPCLPSYSMPDLPPLFDPTEPPPNMKCLLGSNITHEDANPAWSISAQNPIPTVYNNLDVHTGLSTHGGFMPQQLPLEIPSQSSVFLTPHIDTVKFSPVFHAPSSSHLVVNAHGPSTLIQMHAAPHNSCLPSSTAPQRSPSSDSSVNKDDGLSEMQEAMRFAKEMTNIEADEESRSNSKRLSRSGVSIKPVSDVGFIALPPGKPRVKTNRLRRMKRDDAYSKRKVVPEERRTAAERLSPEETTQDANARSKDASLMNEQDRPKVTFNLNNKTKVVSAKAAWQENSERRNGMTQPMELERTHAAPPTRRNLENTSRRNKRGESLKRNGGNSESAVSSESIANQDAALSRKKLQKDVHTQKSQQPVISLHPKVNVQKSRGRTAERNEGSNEETSWKNRIVSRFLKMSKNDIYNMVNDTSLRKFDIIMKRLVKEKKSTLSLEMRHAQDEKMKMYDQQEFMKQLTAMLDTDAIVSVTDLPTEFIHHLNEVLQLDVQPDNHAESAAASSSQCDHPGDTNRAFSPVAHVAECASKTITPNDVGQECVRRKGRVIKVEYDRDVQAHNANELNLTDDTTPILTNIPSASDLSTLQYDLQHDLDDIFSEVTKKNQIPAAAKERKRCNVGQRNPRRFDVGAIPRSDLETEARQEDETAYRLESCPRWDEKCDRWKRKEREDPHAYRNLTKEEWEARYGREAQDAQADLIPPVGVGAEIEASSEKLPNRKGRGKKVYTRRRYSSESSRHPNTRHRTLEKDKHKKSRRHSDDRIHSAGYLEYNNDRNSNSSRSSSSSSSSSSSTSSSSSSSSSDSSDNTNVTKLLRVIKENEKVAKRVSLNEAIRDEVNAEIQRERKSRKSRKHRKTAKARKQKKARHKKKRKQSRKTMSSSDSLSEREDNGGTAGGLLTESEIKREVAEHQITQEVIVKEEVDIGQDENVGDAELASSLVVVENKAAYLLPESRIRSPTATVGAAQLHAEDRLPTASPTQPKTKAQLKQMPETSDMNDNRVPPLNIFTSVPEDWNTIIPPSFVAPGCADDSGAQPCPATDVGCNRDKAEISSVTDSPASRSGDAGPCGGADKSGKPPQRLDAAATAAACTSAEPSAKLRDGNGISATDNDRLAGVSTAATSASSVSSVPAASAPTQRQGASRRIDIKTYYERTVQRRAGEKPESRQSARDPATQVPLAPKATGPAAAPGRPTIVCTPGGSNKDPRLASAARLAANNNESDVAQVPGRDVRQKEKRVTRGSKVAAESAPRHPEAGSGRLVEDGGAVNRIPDQSKDRVSPDGIDAPSNAVTTARVAAPRSGKRSEREEGTADRKSQGKVPPDAKRFRNIRSEGGKELKLRKEMAKEQKAKRRSAAASQSVSLASTRTVHHPPEGTARAEKTEAVARGKRTDNVSDTDKAGVERTAESMDSRESKVNSSDAPPSTVPFGSTDNDEPSRDTKAGARRPSNLEFPERGSAEEAASDDIAGADARERSSPSSGPTRDEETRGVKRAKDAAGAETADEKGEDARETCSVVPEPDIPTASEIVPETEVPGDIEVATKEDFSAFPEIRQSGGTNDTAVPLNCANQAERSDGRDAAESAVDRDVGGVSESDVNSSRADNVDGRSREDRLLTDGHVGIDDAEENNVGLDVAEDTRKSAGGNEDGTPIERTAGSSSASNENSREGGIFARNVPRCALSADNVGSPFKGFLRDAVMDFEQPNLFGLKLEEIDADRSKLFSDDCHVNYVTHPASCEDARIGDYADDANIDASESFNIAFGETLLAAGKVCATSERSDGSDLLADDGNGGGRATEAPGGMAAAAAHDGDDGIGIDGADEMGGSLMNKVGYASCAGLTIKGSMFIGEEEIIQGEGQTGDLTSKMKTATDPSLSDALETTISDDALRLPEVAPGQPLDGHGMYLEASAAAEKAPSDKLPDYDSDGRLDGDMFYLDDPLQSAAAFDNRDDEPAHFSVRQRSPPPGYDVAPEAATTIAPRANGDAVKCEFDFERTSPTVSNDPPGSAERSPTGSTTPRTLNVPTKAALKESAATNLFPRSPCDMPTEVVALGVSDNTERGEADPSYRAPPPAWRADVQKSTETRRRPGAHNNSTTVARDFPNVNTLSSARNGTCDELGHGDAGVDHGGPAVPGASIDERLRGGGVRCNPYVELRKIKELDDLVAKRGRLISERVKGRGTRGARKKRNGTILRKMKDKGRQSKRTARGCSLVKRLKKMRRTERITGTTREAILARMLEIDLEMQKLATEKLKLHEVLQSGNFAGGSPAADDGAVPGTRRDDAAAPGRPEVTPASQSARNGEAGRAKHAKRTSSPRPSPIEERKRASPGSSDDDNEVTSYTQRTKMPVIRWKKKPRLEQTVRREEDRDDDDDEDEDEREDPGETTEQRRASAVSEKVEDDSVDASEDVVRRSGSNTLNADETRKEKVAEKSDAEAAREADSRRATCSDETASDKNADWQDLAEGKTKRAEHPDVDKRDDAPPPTGEAAGASAQPSGVLVRGTPEPLSIYSDDSTWDSLVQNTASEMHETRKETGLVLLDETLRKQLARSQKMKAIVRRKKKRQLDDFLRTVNILTTKEEELPLSKLYIRKLQQKRDLLDSLNRRREDGELAVDPSVLRNMDEVINAVAENRVGDLYVAPPEARAPDDAPATSDVPADDASPPPDRHQFYVDAEANANSDWPCRDKESAAEAAPRQDSDEAPGADGSNHVFKAVNRDKVLFADERNVEPDSSVAPAETPMEESRSSDPSDPSEPACPKDPDGTALRNFDIKVSVPKVLIKDDFSLGLLQKFKGTESGGGVVVVVGAGLVDSTTNALAASSERSEEMDKSPRNASRVARSSAEEVDKKEERSEPADKRAAGASETEETLPAPPSAPRSSAAKSGDPDAAANEGSADGVTSNRYDKIAIRDTGPDSSVTDSTAEGTDARRKEPDAESGQPANDATATRQDCERAVGAAEGEDGRGDAESKPSALERIPDNDPSTSRSPVPADRASEGKSEESSGASFAERRPDPERRTATPASSLDKAAARGGEPSKKLRRRCGNATPVRRSARNSNECAKPGSRVSEAVDANSNGSEREPSAPRERDTIARSASPASAMRDERVANGAKRSRATQKVQGAGSRKADAESAAAKVENPVRRLAAIAAESAASGRGGAQVARKRRHTEWQMRNCKVRLVDCKAALPRHADPEVLDGPAIVLVNPCAPSDACTQRAAAAAAIPAADEGPCLTDEHRDKEEPEIEILEEKPVAEGNDDCLAQGSVAPATETGEEEPSRTQYTVHKGPILDIKVFENSFLAASEDGQVYRYSQTSNGILNIYKGHKSAVTCLYVSKSDAAGVNKEFMYSGSLDGTLRCHNITTGALVKNPAQINSPIQCMDQSWGMIFIGTKSGHVSRFLIKTGAIKGSSIQFSEKSVLALKATNEGPRKILIVASRNQPITIRDAQTGLFLRTISGQKNHTVYSLLRHDNLIYCGTSSTSINVFDFTLGEQAVQYEAGVGIVCMRLYKQLLFAGCYDGNIYVFDIRNHKLVCSIHGPGNMLLSIEVVNNKIIAGSKDKRLHSWQMPTQVRALL